ncbi:MAG: hypothetical protein LOD92_04645 [Bacillales bacterium]
MSLSKNYLKVFRRGLLVVPPKEGKQQTEQVKREVAVPAVTMSVHGDFCIQKARSAFIREKDGRDFRAIDECRTSKPKET